MNKPPEQASVDLVQFNLTNLCQLFVAKRILSFDLMVTL